MKLTKIFFIFAAVAVLFASCKSEVEITGITLDEATLSVAVGDTATLTATLLPKGSEGDVAWTSSNSEVATVKAGEVIGIKEGTANIIATVGSFSATCAVTVTKKMADFSASLKGTAYYPIILDGTTAAKLGAKIKIDFRPDEINKFLYIWPDGTSYSAGTSVGPNFYGEVEGWTSLIVGNIGWSGAGFFTKDTASISTFNKEVIRNADKYFLHIGIRSKKMGSHVIVFYDQSGGEFKLVLGASAMENTQPYKDFTRDGEWQEIEVPMTYFTNKGLLYKTIPTTSTGGNILAVLSGGTSGETLDIDALFFYKK